jgi:predicted transcriptional regulator
MPPSSTLTIRLSPDVKDKLARLAQDTRRSKSFHAGEAVEAYVARELDIIDGLHAGLADAAAGRVVPHEAAMAEVYEVIETASGRKV